MAGRTRKRRFLRLVEAGLGATLTLFWSPRGAAIEPPPLPPQPYFGRLTTADGLPDDTVRSLLQDRLGFLWIGTQNGLARYDGTEIRVHRPVAHDSTGIGGRAIFALHEEPSGRIWAGTAGGGLSCLDPRTGIFTNYSSETSGPGDLPGRFVLGIGSTPDSTLWVALQDGGLAYQRPNGPFVRVDRPTDPSSHADVDSMTALLVASDGMIYVGIARGGLGRYDPATRTWRLMLPRADRPHGPRPGLISHIVQDRVGRIWLATAVGLALCDPELETLRWYEAQADAPSEWDNYMTRIAEDANGRLWIGSAVGLYRFEPASGSFRLFRHDPRRPGSLAPGPVMSVLCDRSGAIWTGSWQSGLSCLDPWRIRFEVLTHADDDPGSLDQDGVVSVLEGRDGTLWVGTGGVTGVNEVGRLNRRLPGESTFTRIPFESAAQVRTVLALSEDAKGDIWIGTDRGLWFLPRGATRAQLPVVRGLDGAALAASGVYALQFDLEGGLWIGTFGRGLFRIDFARGMVSNDVHDPADSHSLSQNRITCLHCDASGRMWIGTSTAGLNLFDPKTGGFHRFLEPRSGLGLITDIEDAEDGAVHVATGAGLFIVHPDTSSNPDSDRTCGPVDVAISGLARQESGELWIHTARGLLRCSAGQQGTQTYDAYSGVPGGDPYFGSHRGHSGLMYFGSKHGLLVVDPKILRVNPYVPPVVITGLQVNDEPMGSAARGTGGRDFPFVERVVLPHDRNDLRFSFAALQLAQPGRNRFRYQLQGDDRDWRGPSTEGVANYTNLAPGRYVFQVHVGTSQGGWGPHAASLRIDIQPPWWRTAWAHTVYVLLAIASAVLVYRFIVQRERIRTALEVQRAETRHLQELDQVKSRFFANISHEFRTPLTLILGPLHRLRQSARGDSSVALGMIDRNARRLGELIEQLLDLSRLEAGRMTVRWQRRDILLWLQALVASFDSLATDRRITLTARVPKEPLQVWFEPDLFEKIVVNLLSNAMKFTPAGGTVRVTVDVGGVVTASVPDVAGDDSAHGEVDAREVRVAVANTGSYIPPEEQQRIFERFQQLDEGMSTGGTGIGLALTKELIDLLGGSIAVESHPDRHTCFTATLPTYVTSPVPGLTEPDAPRLAIHDVGVSETDATLESASDEPEVDRHQDREVAPPRVLVVEDNADLRAFLVTELGDAYDVLQAPDGLSGLATALEELPDLVLSDVIMPGLDGIELCRRLKADERTDHIPIVLLSARTEVESRLAGLSGGADDYQAKPFDARELRLRIHNLIEERRRLRERYARQVVQLGPAAMPVTSAQERFLKRAREIIDSHVDDTAFGVEQMAHEIGMSKAQLLRKVRAVTGAAPRDLIRTHRLQRAAHLLASGYGNVTEVAYAVGMESLSTFAKRFREQYGVAPSEYSSTHPSPSPQRPARSSRGAAPAPTTTTGRRTHPEADD